MNRNELIAEINKHADYLIKEDLLVSPNDEAFSVSILNELVEVGEKLPESTLLILFGLLVVFEIRHRNEKARSVMQ
ncbi:hypothetical protein Nit79A3_3364 [Nitrosomonas sp. Is79A3]|uniref:hypothetical protein n=1 Tax=Nitrosomonas sp. (strain Is79A3) TaxID=261292 RepID=UPI000215D238